MYMLAIYLRMFIVRLFPKGVPEYGSVMMAAVMNSVRIRSPVMRSVFWERVGGGCLSSLVFSVFCSVCGGCWGESS